MSIRSTPVLDAPGGKPQVICRADMTGSFQMREGETLVSPSEILDPFYGGPAGATCAGGILADLAVTWP